MEAVVVSAEGQEGGAKVEGQGRESAEEGANGAALVEQPAGRETSWWWPRRCRRGSSRLRRRRGRRGSCRQVFS